MQIMARLYYLIQTNRSSFNSESSSTRRKCRLLTNNLTISSYLLLATINDRASSLLPFYIFEKKNALIYISDY